MCGGGVVGDILHPLIDAAVGIGFGPLGEAALQTGEGLADGQGFGRSLRRGALSGLETFGGQEIAGALGSAFPETASSIGYTNTGGNSLSDLIGTSEGAGSLTGPGTVGSQFGNLFSSIMPSSFGSSVATGGSTPSAPGSMTSPGATPSTSSGSVGSGSSGYGASSAASSSPAGSPSSNPIDNLFTNNQTAAPLNLPSLTGEGGSPGSIPQATAAPLNLPQIAGGAGFSDFLNQSSRAPSTLPDLGGSAGADVGGSLSTGGGLDSPVGSEVNLGGTVGANASNATGISNPTLAQNVANNYSSSFNAGTPSVGTGLTSEFANGAGGAPTLNSGGIDAIAGSAPVSEGAAASSGSTFLHGLSGPVGQTASNFTNMLLSNPGSVVGAAGLGIDAFKNNQLVKGQRQLQQEASQFASQGNSLQNYLQTGTLPPGVGQAINQAAEAQKAQIRSRYASAGSSGSSAEQQDLAAADSWAQGQGTTTALQLLTTGINESGLASQLYENISNTALQQDNALGTAIGNFGAAMAGGTGNNSLEQTLFRKLAA